MKKTILLSVILLSLVLMFPSCVLSTDGYIRKETITASVVIDQVGVYKYSKVEGHINYDGFKIHVDNGNTGYYYKKYRLVEGQTILVPLTIYYYSTPSGYELRFDDIDVSRFEIEK